MLKRKAVPVATSLLSLCLACGGGGEETTATTDSTGTSAGPTTSPTTSDPTTASTTDSGSDATTSTTDPMTTMGSTDSDSETTDPTTTTDTETDTSEPEPFCGDGNIDADDGEECDNGPENADDGACTSQCLNAVCGDGFVGPGEACDDGNTEDGDECTNACALASCGDMVVQAPEECDDGNDIDSDACLSSCLIAVCGDNVVYEGQEECDDANGNNADACTTACMFPTCDDNLQSGAETDLDCGGGDCPPCELGLMCMAPMDCSSGNCDANICAIAASCGQIAMGDPNAPSGVYQLDVDGEGGADPFMAYCDMDIDEGGWTLVLNLDTSDNHVMWWADPLWTDANTHGTAQNALTADYKGEAWNQLAGATEILLVVHEEGALLGWKTFAKVDGATMYDHFQGADNVLIGTAVNALDVGNPDLWANETLVRSSLTLYANHCIQNGGQCTSGSAGSPDGNRISSPQSTPANNLGGGLGNWADMNYCCGANDYGSGKVCNGQAFRTASEAQSGWAPCYGGTGHYGTDSKAPTTNTCSNAGCSQANWSENNGFDYDYSIYLR